MGMTSEEPITHLEWFTDLLNQAGLLPAEHLLVMTLPGSYLDRFAREHHAPSLPIQPDGGTGTGGRMSAPSTRVFLLPVALYLARLSDASGQLRAVLQQAWDEYDLELAASRPAEHPFVQLAAALSNASRDEACRLLLKMPEEWHILVSWVEQLMEESLGKGGKGIVIFDDQPLNAAAPFYRQEGMLRVHVVKEKAQAAQAHHFTLFQPSLARKDPLHRLAALAASFLGWQLSMALYGYVQRIPFAGQPAAENYKAKARALRAQSDPLQVASRWQPAVREGLLTLLTPPESFDQDAFQQSTSRRGGAEIREQGAAEAGLAGVFAQAVPHAGRGAAHPSSTGDTLGYLDVTVNGHASAHVLSVSFVEKLFVFLTHKFLASLLQTSLQSRLAPYCYWLGLPRNISRSYRSVAGRSLADGGRKKNQRFRRNSFRSAVPAYSRSGLMFCQIKFREPRKNDRLHDLGIQKRCGVVHRKVMCRSMPVQRAEMGEMLQVGRKKIFDKQHSVLGEQAHVLGNECLGIPVKLRVAPSCYHSTEQSEMDGPPSLVSLRLVARNSEERLLGRYTPTFLHAQAVSTWQAMLEVSRPCFLLVIEGALGDATEPLTTFLSQVEQELHRH